MRTQPPAHCLWALVSEVPRNQRTDRPTWKGQNAMSPPRPLPKFCVSHPVCRRMRPVRAEVEAWHLSLEIPGQHSTLASNLRLRREGGSQPLLLKWLATFPSCFVFLKRNLAGKLGLVGARGRWSSLALCEPRCGPQFRTIAPSYLQLSQRRAMRRCSFMPLVGAPRWVGARALKSSYPNMDVPYSDKSVSPQKGWKTIQDGRTGL